MEKIWNNLLTRFDSEESIAFMLFLIGAFLIGLILSWLIHGGRARRRKREIDRLNTEVADLKVKIAQQQEEIELKDADLIRANREVEEWSETVKQLHAERHEQTQHYETLQQQNAPLSQAANGYIETIDALNNQIIGLKTRVGNGGGSGPSVAADEDVTAVSARYESRLSELEARLAQLESIRAQMGNGDAVDAGAVTRGRGIENEPPLIAAAALPPLDGGKSDDAVEEPVRKKSPDGDEVVGRIIDTGADPNPTDNDGDLGVLETVDNGGRAALTERLGAKIPAPIVLGDRDDLTMIKGVGPFLEKQLNEIGIYRFEQIAHWNEGEIERVTEAIGYFPGRILRDDWVGQAARLNEIRENYPNALEVGAMRAKQQNIDDLKVVEGIGPAVEKLLKANGVRTLNDLRNTSYERLREILDSGGSKFRIHDPMTWSDQAGLAAVGKWRQLEDLQQQLRAGRDDR